MRTEGLCGRKCVRAPGEVYWASVGLAGVQAAGDAWENRGWDGEEPWDALLPQGRSQAPIPPRLPCSKEVSILEKVGNDFKNYGTAGLVLSGGATLIAPESGAELGIEPSLAAIAVGNALTSSTSLTRAVFNGGNGSGATLSYINDQVLAAAHIPENAVPIIEPLLDKAEEAAGLTAGDAGTCHQ